MSTVVATDAASQQQIQAKLTAVKVWAKDRNLPKQVCVNRLPPCAAPSAAARFEL